MAALTESPLMCTPQTILLFSHWRACKSALLPFGTVHTIYRMGTPLPSKYPVLFIFSTNTHTEFFKHAAHSLFLSLQNAVYFIMLPFMVPVLFTFCIQVC
jgi:hypothetical protein